MGRYRGLRCEKPVTRIDSLHHAGIGRDDPAGDRGCRRSKAWASLPRAVVTRAGDQMTVVGKEPGVSWLSVIWSARHDPDARLLNVDLLAVLVDPFAVVDERRQHRAGAVADRARFHGRTAPALAIAGETGLRAADRLLCLGASGDALVGCSLERTAPWREPARKISGPAADHLSFR